LPPPMRPGRRPRPERRPGGGSTIENYSPFPDSVVNDVVPFVESNYRVIGNRDSRAIAGFSLGGAATLFVRFIDVETEVYAHLWNFWRISLTDVAQRLFK
jgi:predicted alpha/beta superfamily hydrolase